MTTTTTPSTTLSDRDRLVAHLVDQHCSIAAPDLSLLGARLAHASDHQAGPPCVPHAHDRPNR